MDKNKIIIILTIILVVMVAGILFYVLHDNQVEVAVSQTATITLPEGKGISANWVNGTEIYQVTNGEGVSIMSYNSEQSKDLASAVGFSAVKQLMVGDAHNDNTVWKTNINGSDVYSISIFNDTTHDNIIISTPSEDLTRKIAESVKYGKTNGTNDTQNNTNTNSYNDVNNTNNSLNGSGSNVPGGNDDTLKNKQGNPSSGDGGRPTTVEERDAYQPKTSSNPSKGVETVVDR